MTLTTPTRRHVLTSGAAAGLAAFGSARPGHAETRPENGFAYEVQRSDAEWRAMLSPEEYEILRLGGTEPRLSSPLVEETRSGAYHCRGCDLTVYESRWKTQLDVGWVFFQHSCPDAVLTGIDEPDPAEANEMGNLPDAKISVHCRRCASHLGHILIVRVDLLHCINGTSLKFVENGA